MSPTSVIVPRTLCKPGPGQPACLDSSPFVAIDVETTGVDDDCRVLEIAAVRFGPGGEFLGEFSSLTNPGCDMVWNPGAQRIHGITAGMIAQAPPIGEALAALADFVGSSPVAAHNLEFESTFLSREYGRSAAQAPTWQGVCTLEAARAYCGTTSHRLAALIDLFDLPATNNHRALDDAKACGLLLAAMMRRHNLVALKPVPQEAIGA